jgi:hypothetical protein
MTTIEIHDTGCPHCGFLEVSTTPQARGLEEFQCDRCSFRWDNTMTIADVEQAVLTWRANQELWAQARRDADPGCPPGHRGSAGYPCTDCTDRAMLRLLESPQAKAFKDEVQPGRPSLPPPDDIPPAPARLRLGWFGAYPALIADTPPSTVTGAGTVDLTRQPWLSAGFAPANPGWMPPPPRLPGWTVHTRGGALAAVTVNAAPWWAADATGRCVRIPPEWRHAARVKDAVVILAGDIGAHLVTTNTDYDPHYRAAVNRAFQADRLAYGLAALAEDA